MKERAARRRGGIELLGKGVKRDVGGVQPVDRLDELGQRSRQAVELPDDERVPGGQVSESFV